MAAPPPAEYQVRLKDRTGTVVAIFTDWINLSWVNRVSGIGSYRLEINGLDSRRSLFQLDSQVEIWRRIPGLDIDWYVEFEGVHRTPNFYITEEGISRYVSYGFSYNHFLKRRRIMYYPNTSYSRKDGAGETVIKEFVNENAGPSATFGPRIGKSGVTSGLSIQADSGLGLNWAGARAYKNLLPVIQKIAMVTGLDFDIIGIGDALFEFRTYEGQRGLDRTTVGLDTSTGLNSAGNAPHIFSTSYGNMLSPILSLNRSTEVTSLFGLGNGIEDGRNIILTETTATTDSPWNDIEDIRNLSANFSDAEIEDESLEYLERKAAREVFNFKPIQQESSYYGVHYWFGDLITGYFDGNEYNKKIVESRGSVGAKAKRSPEVITIHFDDF